MPVLTVFNGIRRSLDVSWLCDYLISTYSGSLLIVFSGLAGVGLVTVEMFILVTMTQHFLSVLIYRCT